MFSHQVELSAATLTLLCLLVHGKYYVEVQVFNYSNPSGKCRDCQLPGYVHEWSTSCCDDAEDFGACSGSQRCDSYFTYCLRPFGSEGKGCAHKENWTSTVNENDRGIHFSRKTVLGLENPLKLPGLTNGDRSMDQVCYDIIDNFLFETLY